MSPLTRTQRRVLCQAENAVSAAVCGRVCTEVEFRRIQRGSSDRELLRIRGLGPRGLAVFRQRYSVAAERPEDV